MLIEPNAGGLYCAAGGFHIDPWQPVERAIITHAHGDHLRYGSRSYLCAEAGRALVAHRLGDASRVESLPYSMAVDLNGVRVSFHPAGHIFGSSQVRVEYRGEVWVSSGDYCAAGKRASRDRVHRLHVCRVGRGRARAGGEGVLRIVRR